MPTYATSFSNSIDQPYHSPRLGSLPLRSSNLPSHLPQSWIDKTPSPLQNMKFSLTHETREDLQDLLRSVSTAEASKENTTDHLKNLINDLHQNNRGIFIDPITGETILADMITEKKYRPQQEDRPDLLKGCISKTKCVGTGKDQVCDTWEVCVSSDD
jgi:hypothetical protein